MKIEKSKYGKSSSNNYGAHTIRLDIGVLTLWFSYDTVVAFQVDGHLRRVCENCWQTTTGKHLNWIDGGDKKSRLAADIFENELAALLKAHKLEL